MRSTLCEEEWRLVKSLLPGDLEMLARQSGALQRARGVKDAETLLRLLFLHVAGGLSLEQTALRAAQLGLAEISAVALFKRLRSARPWLEELCTQVIAERTAAHPVEWPLPGRTYRVLDATDIREPGATGSSWRLHYSITLPGLRCDFARFTPHTTGERLQQLPAKPGDIVLADRAYGKRAQIAWLMDAGADAVIRLHPPAFPVLEPSDEDETDLPVDWLAKLDTLPALKPGEWTVHFKSGAKSYRVRVCAIRKSATAAAGARHRLEVEARKKGRVPQEQNLRLTDFVVVLTTLSTRQLSTARVLDLYRCRWQVELAFKRLKSLLAFSAVPKSDAESARSWMQTKLLESLLIERLLEQSRALSPWGYVL
jgi:hypothetical protein